MTTTATALAGTRTSDHEVRLIVGVPVVVLWDGKNSCAIIGDDPTLFADGFRAVSGLARTQRRIAATRIDNALNLLDIVILAPFDSTEVVDAHRPLPVPTTKSLSFAVGTPAVAVWDGGFTLVVFGDDPYDFPETPDVVASLNETQREIVAARLRGVTRLLWSFGPDTASA